MPDIQQATNPALQSPVTLDEEALRPVDVSNMERLQRILPKLQEKAEQDAPKRIGRPPGSKNKSTESKVQAPFRDTRTPAERMTTRTGTPAKPGNRDDFKKGISKEDKKKRVEDIASSISSGINDNIAILLGSMGMPTALIYKPGREPKHVTDNSPYTEFVGQVLIPDSAAETWAKFYVELEQTDMGKRLSGVGDGAGKGALVVYGALSLLAAMQYVQGINNFRAQVQPFLEQMRANKLQEEAKEQANG